MNPNSIFWELTITHDFFKDRECPTLNLMFGPETQSLMVRNDIRLIDVSPGKWEFMNLGIDADPIDTFEVEIYSRNPIFPFITVYPEFKAGQSLQLELDGSEGSFSLSEGMGSYQAAPSGVLLRIKLNPHKYKPGRIIKTEIRLHAPEYYWEYLFISRDGQTMRRLIMDDNLKYEFEELEPIDYMERRAVRFMSRKKIPLRQYSDHKIRLTEILPNKKKELYRQLPVPRPGYFTDAPPETVRNVVYI